MANAIVVAVPSYKIFFQNIGYCGGVNGSWQDYAFKVHKQIVPTRRVQEPIEQQIVAHVQEHKPDVCCFTEVTPSSFERLRQQLQATHPVSDVANKYGQHTMVSRMPWLTNRANAVFSGSATKQIKQHFVRSGLKRLVHDVHLPDDTRVIMFHATCIPAAVRRKQFAELAELFTDDERVIVCGDFNIFKGFSELEPLLSKRNLRVVNQATDHTYPAAKPKHALDVFLCSPSVDVTSFTVHPEHTYSDHLGITLECAV